MSGHKGKGQPIGGQKTCRCDCRPCHFGYHCSPCSKAHIKETRRLKSIRSAFRKRERRRQAGATEGHRDEKIRLREAGQ